MLPNQISNYLKKYQLFITILSGIIISFLLLTTAIVVSSKKDNTHTLPPHNLTVFVRDIKTQLPITHGSVEVVLDEGRIFLRAPLDASGSASFSVQSGTYTVRMASGFSGQSKIRVNSHYTLPLEVIPILD